MRSTTAATVSTCSSATTSAGHDIGYALRQAFDWPTVTWDLITAAVAVYYWTLRSTYGPLMRGAALFEDLKEKH